MIVVCYDGSDESLDAVERAAGLFGDRPATVLTVWEPYIDMIAQSGFGLGYVPVDERSIDEELRTKAADVAAEGATALRRAGGTAEGVERMREHTTADTILAVARELDAEAIVIGTRGRGGVRSALLGSVSHAVVQHADRPVVVVPSADVAAARAKS